MAFNAATAQPEATAFDPGSASPEIDGPSSSSFKFDAATAAPEAADLRSKIEQAGALPKRHRPPIIPAGVAMPTGEEKSASIIPESAVNVATPWVQRMLQGQGVGLFPAPYGPVDPNAASAGVARAGLEFGRGLTTPLNLAMMAGGAALPAIGRKALAGLFAAKMAADTGEQAASAIDVRDDPNATPAQRAAAYTAPVLTGLGSLAAAGSMFDKPAGPAAVTDADLARAKNVTPTEAQPALAGQPSRLALNAAPVEPKAPPPTFREGQEVTFTPPGEQQAKRGIVEAPTNTGRVKITAEDGKIVRIPVANVAEVSTQEIKAPQGFDPDTAEIEVSLSEPDVVAQETADKPATSTTTEVPAGTSPVVAEKIAYLDEQLSTREITPEEHAQQTAEVLKQAPVAIGPRNADISTGTGVETPHETAMMQKWREQNSAEISQQATKQSDSQPLDAKSKRLLKAPSTTASIQAYFTPGREVDSYGGGKDIVQSFQAPEQPGLPWSVIVKGEDGRIREHSTFPGRDKIIATLGRRRYLETQNPKFKAQKSQLAGGNANFDEQSAAQEPDIPATSDPLEQDAKGSQRGAVDERVLRALGVTGAAGGGAAYGYSQGATPEDRLRKAVAYGAAAGVAAYIVSKIPAAFSDSAAGGMSVAMRAAKNSLENAVIGGKDLPNMRAASESATNAAFRLANAKIFGVQQGLNLAAKVLGDHWNDLVFAEKLGSVLVQEIQEAKIIQLHDDLLKAKTPGERAKIQGQIDRVKPVWDMPATQINSPDEFRAALADPEIQAAIERHKKLVQATAEQIHAELGGKLAAVGPNTGAFINTEAILAGDDLPGAANKGDLQNVLKRKSTFGKQRTGTADQYEIDYNRQVARMAAGNAERIAKKDYYDVLEQEGLAKVTQPGERPDDAEKFRRERTQELSVTGQLEDTWIRRDIFGEHRQLMNTDSPLDNHLAIVIARLMNTVQLKSITDPTFHIANIVSSITGAQGGGSRLADIARQLPGVNIADALVRVGNKISDVVQMNPETRADLAEIARVGALREGHPGIVNTVDRAGRLVMNDLFQNLVDEGLAEDSEGNRRDFVNQIGQYNGRLMGKLKALFKEIGVAPFVVAGQNFNRLGVRRLLQQPGVKATNGAAAAKMVGTAFGGTLASLVAAPAIFNYLVNRDDDRVKNKLLGPSGTPVGAIGWQDPDANGKLGTLHYVDPLKWTNLRRGARITGLNAAATGYVQGRDLNHTVGQAWEDIRNGAVQPWAGPAVNAFSILQTGKNAAGFQEAEVANPLDRTQAPTAAQTGKNAQAALAHLQPQVAAFLQGGRDKNPAKFDSSAGAKGVVKSLARAGGYFERNPVDAEHGSAESALYGEELGREQRREQIQKLASGWPAMSQAEKVKATDGMSELDGKDLVEALRQNSMGFTSSDRMIKSMGVEDGARAKYLAEQVMKLAPTEQLKYLDDKEKKGLITENVGEQLVEELRARGWRAPAGK